MKKLIPAMIVMLLIFSSFASAFSILSLDQIDFSFDGDEFQKQWLLLISSDNRGDFVKATRTFDAEEIKSGELHAENDVTISSETTTKQCVYNMKSTSESIRKLTYYTYTRLDFWNIKEKRSTCEGKSDYFMWVEPLVSTKGYCFYFTTDSMVGTVSSKKYSFLEEITVEANNIEKTATLSNDPNLGSVSDSVPNYMTARWNGNLGTGTECPSINDKTPVYDTNKAEWKLVSNVNLQNYRSYHTNRARECLEKFKSKLFGDDNTLAQACLDEYNYFSDKAQTPEIFRIKTSYGTINKLSSTSGEIIVNDVDSYQIPVITLKLNAEIDWVGIVQPRTKPEITRLESKCFTVGKTDGYITATIRNRGDKGAVSIRTQCEYPFRVEGTTPIIQLDAGETTTISIPITATTKTRTKAECTVTVQDETDPTIKDSRTVEVCVEPIVVCTAGTKRCNGKNIEQCNSDGSGWDVITVCGGNCEVKDNQYICSGAIKEICNDEIDNDGDGLIDMDDPDCKGKICEWYDIKCHVKKLGFLKIMLWFATIAGGVFVMLSSFHFTNKRTQNKVLSWVIGIVMGIFTAVMIFVYLYIGLVIFFILLLLGLFLPIPKGITRRATGRIKKGAGLVRKR